MKKISLKGVGDNNGFFEVGVPGVIPSNLETVRFPLDLAVVMDKEGLDGPELVTVRFADIGDKEEDISHYLHPMTGQTVGEMLEDKFKERIVRLYKEQHRIERDFD